MTHVTKKMVGDVVVLYPKGMFLGGKETDELETTLMEPFLKGHDKVVLNLHDTAYLSTPGITALVRAHTHYTKRGGRICVCNVNDRITMLFVIVKLTNVFDTYETEDDAVASFKGWTPPEVPEAIAAEQ